MTYEEVYSDHSFLFNEIGSANDMTGGYVDSQDLDRLLKSPSKRTAKSILIDQMRYWFQVGIETTWPWNGLTDANDIAAEEPRVAAIAEKYGFEFGLT